MSCISSIVHEYVEASPEFLFNPQLRPFPYYINQRVLEEKTKQLTSKFFSKSFYNTKK